MSFAESPSCLLEGTLHIGQDARLLIFDHDGPQANKKPDEQEHGEVKRVV